ncbi:MAG: hypothetical protein HY043_21025 [Verrucomicrobia bacterium]|nr:hypothetical protein [Verrucomicrobiota bacterium]
MSDYTFATVNLSPAMLAWMDDSLVQTPAFRNEDLIAWLLIALLSLVFVLGAVCVFLVLQLRRSIRWQKSNAKLVEKKSALPSVRQLRPVLYEAPHRWLAIKFEYPQAVQAALDLHRPMPCSWEQGLAGVREDKMFISPPVKGWILVIGSGLPDPADDVDFVFRFVLHLSRTFGEVQYFCANRATNSHAWVRAESARIIRAYAWAGSTIWNQGDVTDEERELELRCFAYGEAPPPSFPPTQTHRLNAEKVSRLAGRWSLDPTALDARAIPPHPGIAGEFYFNKPH